MRTALRKMGNSTGMIVPKVLLSEMGLAAGATIDLRIEDGKLVARPERKVREGWAEDAEKVAAHSLTDEEKDWLGFGNDGDAELEW
jgi:antitoxin MazE